MSDIKYNRPNENWECGWKKKGFQCHVGPTNKGKCPGKGECQPVKKEDGYHCTRLPQYGGKCHQGPMPNGECSKKFPPCSPQRSLRAKRGLTTLLISVLSLAVIFFQLGSTQTGTDFFSPGALSFKHSSILNNCTTCHTGAHDQPLAWLASAGVGALESKNCLGCHKMGEHATKAHSLDPSELSEITKGLWGGRKGHPPTPKKVQCNTCHKEHRGANFDLTAMTKKQCQNCHVEKFDSLSKGHPEFSNYPSDQRTHILFDHTEHFNKHFPEKEAKNISCNSCHTPSASGGEMELKGFKKACATCHSDQIYGDNAVEKGVVFLRLPTLDIDTLKEKGVRVGSWPEDADGELTPFMKILLHGHEETKGSMAHIESNELELDDLSEAEKEDLEHVETVIWGIKKLLKELSTEGAEKIKERLESTGKVEMSREALVELAGSLPVDVVRVASRLWFHKLDSELEKLEGGNKRSTRSHAPDDENEDEDQMTGGGWYKDTGTFTIKYRPTGHGDKFIKSWLNMTAKMGEWSTAQGIFADLSHRKESVGSCMKCHSVFKEKKEYKVNWVGRLSPMGEQKFVRFSHQSHLNLLKDEGCYTCHKVNPEADFSKAYEGFDKMVFESNFFSLKKKTCTRCHQEGQVKDNCLTCHNYHVGNFFSSEEQMKHIRTQISNDSEDKKE